MKMKKRPHIIILNPDEMRWDTMGHMGNAAAHTPALDAFAENDAVSFRRAYCQNTVCVPSRCSFLTGLYPHTRGHRTMKYLLHEGETSLFRQLREAGYYVWLNGRNDLVAGQITGLEEWHADEIFYYDKGKVPRRVDLKMPGGMRGAEKCAAQSEERHVYDHFGGIREGRGPGWNEDWTDTYAAIERIKHPVEPEKPLCLFLGWTNPHVPYQIERKYYDMVDGNAIVDEIDPAGQQGKSRMIEKLQELSGLENKTAEEWRELRHVYLAQCAKVDDMFRAVCDALKEAGMYDDSAIFFLSDHGDFAGDYHLAEKAQNTYEDVLSRVPLLVKPPKMVDGDGRELFPCDAGVAGGVVELVDFYATVMDFAGVEPSDDHFGRSLRPVVADRNVRVREYAHCEGGRLAHEEQCDEWHSDPPEPGKDDYWAKKTAQLDDGAHCKTTMVTDGHYKFVQHLNGEHELYCLDDDARELKNLYVTEEKNADDTFTDGALQGVTWRMQAELLRWYQETCDVVPKKYDNRFSEERIWATLRNFVPEEMEGEMREYIRREQPGIPGAIRHALTGNWVGHRERPPFCM
jgi:arylsulfatase A-like enzyme